MIGFGSGSCLSKLERVKENILEVFHIRIKNQFITPYSKKPWPCSLLRAFICEFLSIEMKLSGGGNGMLF
jgi:hypothetical protein